MTIYCYLCGGAVQVQPVVEQVNAVTKTTIEVFFQRTIVEHTCPQPQDA